MDNRKWNIGNTLVKTGRIDDNVNPRSSLDPIEQGQCLTRSFN